ncbi:MAG: glycosyl hydrolase 2 galactose-binding domain-containing protein, partial [Flavobacteriales bacterium]
MKHLLLALAVSLGLASCQQEVVSVIDLSKADWQWSSPDSSSIRPFDACMPGHVLEALVEADLAPNPYLGTHERDVQWVETLPWHLRTHLP